MAKWSPCLRLSESGCRCAPGTSPLAAPGTSSRVGARQAALRNRGRGAECRSLARRQPRSFGEGAACARKSPRGAPTHARPGISGARKRLLLRSRSPPPRAAEATEPNGEPRPLAPLGPCAPGALYAQHRRPGAGAAPVRTGLRGCGRARLARRAPVFFAGPAWGSRRAPGGG